MIIFLCYIIANFEFPLINFLLIRWSVCSAVMLSLLYGLYDTKLDAYTSAAYSSLSHTAWALGTAWVIVACSTGHGGPVGRLLSAPSLYPLSRVTYCAYLIHPLIIRMMVMYVDSPLHLARTTVVRKNLQCAFYQLS